MSLKDLTSRDAVLSAVTEFDALGQDAFLAKYQFRPAQRYFLEFEGRLYDSKAIVGAAYGFQYPDRGALKPREFGGGKETVQRKLEQLGFAIRVLAPPSPPRTG